MSQQKRDLAKQAQRHLKQAKENSQAAEKIFKTIGDPDGAKFAGGAAKQAEEGENHVTKKLGNDD